MTRAGRVAPWLYATVAFVLVALVGTNGTLPDPAWRLIILTTGISAAMLAWYCRSTPRAFVAVAAVATVRLAADHVEGGPDPLDGLSAGHALSDLLVGLGLVAILAIALRLRHGTFTSRDRIDGLAVLVGASLAAWLAITNPLLEQGRVSPMLAVLAAAYLPLAALVFTFTVDLLLTGLADNRAMQLLVAAAAANLAGTVLAGLRLTGAAAIGTNAPTIACFLAAFLLMCAAMTHESAPTTRERWELRDARPPLTNTRLALLMTSFIAPAALMAWTGPSSFVDTTVRVVGAVGLVALAGARLLLAINDSDHDRAQLLLKLERDDLTNLPTRSRFVEIVADLLDETWRSDRQPTIVQVNLDRFKNINDALGHNDANRVLVIVAERLDRTVTAFGGTVARTGGDAFVVVDGSTTSNADAIERVERIRDALGEPIRIGDAPLFVTASIGVAVAPRHRTISAEELVRRADIATHRAKGDGRDRMSVYDDSMQANLAQRMDVEHALHGAVERQEMRLYHQPIVDIVSGQVTGFEALLRWQRGGGNPVAPSEFVPIAEETGIIREIGAWALEEALRSLRCWIDDGIVPPTATMSVNVSPRQIADPGFADVVRQALERSGVVPHLLWIEMTESMMLEEPELAGTTLDRIRSMGVRIALDDFGTGYSSLSLLQQFPIQRIKIDRGFVQRIDEEGNDRSLVRTIVAMAHSMDLDLVAEGVETVHQLRALRDLGCDKAQGYLISHPVPATAIRSTMAALDEFADLSLFHPVESAAPAASTGDGHPERHFALTSRPLARRMV